MGLTIYDCFVLSICSLLDDPNPDDPINREAARVYKEDKQLYNEMVKSSIQKNINEYSFILSETLNLLEPLRSLFSEQEIQNTSFFSKLVKLVEEKRLKKEKQGLEKLLVNSQEKVNKKDLEVKEHKKKTIKLTEDFEEIGSELLEIKKNELTQLLNEIKNKLDNNLHGYLDILLLMPDKSEVNKMAQQNIIDKVTGNDLQKLLLLQHKVNQLEQRINEFQADCSGGNFISFLWLDSFLIFFSL